MYTGAADVAGLTGDEGYMKAMRAVWEDVVYRNMYITGGIGSAGSNEGFTVDYDLPNEQAYCETCASVGMVFWNQRMNALTGEAKYADILEKSLYNGALDGLSLSGDHFFYGNPLASTGKNARREWFGTACCPANIARLVASVGNYIYAKTEDAIWVNLFVGNNTIVPLKNGKVSIKMETNYPWQGNIKFLIDPEKKAQFALHLRKPGWCSGEASPGDLYRFEGNGTGSGAVILINGKLVAAIEEKGYYVINRTWSKDDKVEYVLPMEIRRVLGKDSLKNDVGRVALQRGPLIYCIEGADNFSKAWNIILPENATVNALPYKVLDEEVVALQANLPVLSVNNDGTSVTTENKTVTAIPYYTWCNRGKNEMQVWIPTKIKDIKVNY
jgi:hypothetical protein